MSDQYTPRLLRLEGGMQVILRMARPEDALHLLAMHERLSSHTRFLRYLDAYKHLTLQEAQEMCSPEVHHRMALVATPEDNDSIVIAIAYYVIPDLSKPDTAEPAVLVEDAWQGCGLGSLLLKHLAAFASGHGVRAFTATIHCENQALLRFIDRSGLMYTRKNEAGVFQLEIELGSPEHIARLRTSH